MELQYIRHFLFSFARAVHWIKYSNEIVSLQNMRIIGKLMMLQTNRTFCIFQDLENTASSDAGVRERIASLPPEVSEVSLLANLADRTAADQLSVAVNEAATLLADYNGRLQAEMEDRRRLLTMLRDYTLAQRQLLQQAQSTLEVRF